MGPRHEPAFLEDPNGRPITWSRFRRGLRSAVLEFVVEAAVAAIACLLAAGVILAVLWGWRHHPVATVTAAGCFASLLAFGAWNLRPAARSTRTRLGAIAAGIAVVVLAWLGYVLTSCSCFLF